MAYQPELEGKKGALGTRQIDPKSWGASKLRQPGLLQDRLGSLSATPSMTLIMLPCLLMLSR